MIEPQVFAPADNSTIDALVGVIEHRDVLIRQLASANAEIIQAFDALGFAMKRLGLLKNSHFWQQNGPIAPGAVLDRI